MSPGTSEPTAAPADAPRRADAVRNREKVVAAAEKVFAEQGIDAAAILARRLERFDRDVTGALESDDPGAAFRDVLRQAATRANDLSFPASIYWTGRSNELDEVKQRVTRHMEELLAKGKEAAAIREDAKVSEVWVQFGGVLRSLGDSGESDPVIWQRHADLVADAFRP